MGIRRRITFNISFTCCHEQKEGFAGSLPFNDIATLSTGETNRTRNSLYDWARSVIDYHNETMPDYLEKKCNDIVEDTTYFHFCRLSITDVFAEQFKNGKITKRIEYVEPAELDITDIQKILKGGKRISEVLRR